MSSERWEKQFMVFFQNTLSLNHINIVATIFNAIGALPENQFLEYYSKFYPYLC